MLVPLLYCGTYLHIPYVLFSPQLQIRTVMCLSHGVQQTRKLMVSWVARALWYCSVVFIDTCLKVKFIQGGTKKDYLVTMYNHIHTHQPSFKYSN